MSDYAEDKYERDLTAHRNAVEMARATFEAANREMLAFIRHRETHIAYNRAIEDAKGRAREKPGFHMGVSRGKDVWL